MTGLRVRLGGLLAALVCGGWACDPLPPGTSGQSAAFFCNGMIGMDSQCSKAVAVADSVRAVDPPAGAAGSKAASTGGMVTTGIPGLGGPGIGLGGVGTSSSGGGAGKAEMKSSSVGGMGGGPAAGASGQGGAAGVAGGGAGDSGSLQCPNEVCAPLPPPMSPSQTGGMMFTIVNCCASSGNCGTSLNDAACTETPDSDPQCPEVMTMGFTIPSCCTADGQCGLDGSAFMMGCNDLATVATMAMGFIEVPAPKTCTPKK